MSWTINNSFTITWTSVPSGIKNSNGTKQLCVKVIVSPRFSKERGAADVAQSLFRDWPAFVRRHLTEFDVTFATNGGQTATFSGEAIFDGIATSRQWLRAFPSTEIKDENGEPAKSLNVTDGYACSYDAPAVQDQLKSRRLVSALQAYGQLALQESRELPADRLETFAMLFELNELFEDSWCSLAWGDNGLKYGEFALGTFGDDPPLRNLANASDRLQRIAARNRYRLALDGATRNTVPGDTSFLRTFGRTVRNNVASTATVEAVAFNSKAKSLPDREQRLPPLPFDFAERIALVRNYPNLAERLGVTIDVRVPLSSVLGVPELERAGKQPISELRVWVEPRWNQPNVEAVCPSTRCDLDAGKGLFSASELTPDGSTLDPDHSTGHLRLDKSRNNVRVWALSTTDLDGGALKAFGFVESQGEKVPRIVTDLDGRIVVANPSGARLLTKGRADRIDRGTDIASFLDEEPVNAVLEGLLLVGLPKRKTIQEFGIRGANQVGQPNSTRLSVHLECFETMDQALSVWQMVSPDESESRVSLNQENELGKPPSFRSVGLALVRSDGDKDAVETERRFSAQMASGTAPGNPILVASDLVLGYVPEIWSPSSRSPKGPGKWRSTTRRTESYPILGDTIQTEGYVTVGVAEVEDAAPEDQSEPEKQGTVSPSLFVYTNNSLGATGDFTMARLPGDENAVVDSPDPLNVQLAPIPGTLPLVRYSHISQPPFQYHVRCRVVDVAGNSRKLADDSLGDPRIRLSTLVTREEPITPPRVLTNGQLNLRNNPGSELKLMIARDKVCDTRVLIPPKVSAEMLVRYGKGIAEGLNRCNFRGARLTEFAEVPFLPCIKPEQEITGERNGSPPADQNTPAYLAPNPDTPNDGFYYFPDPACEEVAIAIHTFYSHAYNLPPIRKRVPFYRSRWPHAAPIRLNLCCLDGGEVEPQVEVRGSRLTIYLPRAWQGWLELSSACPNVGVGLRDFSHFSALNDAKYFSSILFARNAYELAESSSASPFATFQQLLGGNTSSSLNLQSLASSRSHEVSPAARNLLSGAFGVVTPSDRIDLICPTPRPLCAPTLTVNGFKKSGSCPREVNDSTVDLNIESMIDEKSTSDVTIIASWKRLEDDAAKGDPRYVRDRTEVLSSEKLAPPITYEATKSNWDTELDLQTPKYRKVRYRISGRSRFTRFYPDVDGKKLIASGANDVVIKHLNCTRPTIVNVDSLVPTLTWTSKIEPLINRPKWRFSSSARYGIRVILGRGWDIGELMGVVVLPTLSEFEIKELNHGELTKDGEDPREVSANLIDSVTQWGTDPTIASQIPNDLPSATDFVGYRHVGGNLRLPALDDPDQTTEDRRVAVLGYKPTWHKQRKLWYCDIGVNRIPSYGCFIRLALVRYQPNSIKNLELSAPVQADFVQLRPQRTVSIVRDPTDKNSQTLRIKIFEPVNEGRTPLVGRGNKSGVKNRFVVHAEQPVAAGSVDKMAWMKDDAISIVAEKRLAAGTLWAGRLIWPQPGGQRRLVIREFEEWHNEHTNLEFEENTAAAPRRREVFCNVLQI